MSRPFSKVTLALVFAAMAAVAIAAAPVRERGKKSAATEAAREPRMAEGAVTPAVKNPERHEQFLARIKQGPIDLLLLGDSITDAWPKKGKASWEKLAAYHPADFGISGDRTEHVLWRITHGELDAVQPKVVVIMIGTNNVGHFPDERPEWAAAGVKKIVETVHAKLPETKVLLLAVFPRIRTQKDPDLPKKVAAVNQIIAKLDDGRMTRYLDIGKVFLDQNGEIPKDIMPDGLHPSDKGYDLWYEAMRPLLEGMMSAAAEAKRPNIVFIFADDHAYQAISAYNDPRKLLQTPNIDRIAKEGMRCDRCLVPNSICGPCRAVVMTGKYSHLNGFYNNTNSRFDGSQTTFPKLLKGAGYQTAIVGKWHLVSDPTGFDYWEILPGQGVYYNPPMIRNGERVKHEGYVSEIITDLALTWLNSRDKSKPFLLMCHHKSPHRDWEPAGKYLGHDGDRNYPVPDTLFDDYSGRGKAEHEQDMMIAKTMNEQDLKFTPRPNLTPEQLKTWNAYYEPRNEAFRKANLQGADLVRWKYNRYMHDYLGCIKSNDESVGRLLKFLDDEGLADNTIIVYSSDQGFYLGEHGWFDKRWIFEESLRTPLVLRWPGVVKPRSVNRDLVSNLDFAETFLDAAGLPIPGEMQGRSLLPILQGRTPSDWRKGFYYHYYEYPGPHSVAKHYGVVTARYKLVHFYEPQFNYWELFDLQKDPRELLSVYDRPEYQAAQQELHAELARLRTQLKLPEQDPPETILKQKPAGAKPKPKRP